MNMATYYNQSGCEPQNVEKIMLLVESKVDF